MFKISVIVPVYKAEKHLPACLKSIAEQTVFNKIQLILVDDGSPDGCGRICDEFAEKYTNTVVIHKENGGVSAARNAGLNAAQGEYIGFVDADDTIASDYYENLLAAIENRGSDMAFGSMTFVYKGQKRMWPCWYPSNTVLEDTLLNEYILKMLTDGNQNSTCVKLLKREIIERNYIRFPVDVKIGEDKMFVLQYLQYCKSAVCTGNCGYIYMDVISSAMHSDKKMLELLSVYDRETDMFVSLGIDRKTVVEKKSSILFEELSDFLQRCYAESFARARFAVKEAFNNKDLMAHIDEGLSFVKANNGRIYNMLADAFAERNITKTLFVLVIQNIITKNGERK